MNKTLDLFMFSGELDILEIRFHILNEFVDYFVIGESMETFSGKEKPLYFKLNEERFSKWKDKIVYVVIGKHDCKDAFERAAFQKDSLRNTLNHENLSPWVSPEDIIYYGDVDEIWKTQEVGEKVYKLRQKCYSYYLNMRSSEDWQGTNVCRYKNLYDLNQLRANHENILEDGGWHFTNMGGANQIRKKLEAYDHQEYNSDSVKGKIEERMQNGEDYVGRKFDWQGKPFEMWIDDTELPSYIKDNKDKYLHLIKNKM